MAWLDDRIWAHPKYQRVDPAARWVAVSAICYSSGFGRRGRLDKGEQRLVGSNSRIRKQLVEAGLWHNDGDDILIHDWDEHNGARDDKKEHERELARERKRRQRAREQAVHPEQVTLDVTPVTRDIERDKGRDAPRARVHLRAGARPMTSDGMTEGPDQEQQQTSTENLDVDAARENLNGSGSAAAESALECARDGEVEAAVKELRDHDARSLSQVLPIARQLPAALFRDVVYRTDVRIEGGKVRNHTGLFVELLRTAHHELQARTAADHKPLTTEQDIDFQARSYARGKHPWTIAQPLLELRIHRLDAQADKGALLDLARAAYSDELDPEPQLGSSTTTASAPTITS